MEAKDRIRNLESESSNNERGLEAQVEQLTATIADRDRMLRETLQEQQTTITDRNSLNDVMDQQLELVSRCHIHVSHSVYPCIRYILLLHVIINF